MIVDICNEGTSHSYLSSKRVNAWVPIASSDAPIDRQNIENPFIGASLLFLKVDQKQVREQSL